jgi:uncharacterized membrane protein YjgN (DUF898 family)
MENTENTISNNVYSLAFKGKGSEFFGVVIVNWLLMLVTLGFYYPWAKTKQTKYLYNATTLNGDSFNFTGTGKEIFVGFIKTILLFSLLFSIPVIFASLHYPPFIGVIFLYLILFLILPIIIHGSVRYKLSRSSWRGIRFGYRGTKKEIILKFYGWVLLTILTLGIYTSWLAVNFTSYLLKNIRFGSLEFKFSGSGSRYFIINLKGFILTILTLGIYSFWFQRERFAFFIENISVHQGDKELKWKSTATGFGFLKLGFGNLFILLFSLGLAYPWVITRTFSFIVSSITISGDVDLDSIQQTEEEYKNAFGEDMGDFLDLNFI